MLSIGGVESRVEYRLCVCVCVSARMQCLWLYLFTVRARHSLLSALVEVEGVDLHWK